MAVPRESASDLLARWADQIQSIARLGLNYATDDFDRDRYARLRDLAAEMFGCLTGDLPANFVQVWDRDHGYVTPKVGVAGAILDGRGRILLIQRPDSGAWAMPGGWAEIGDTAAANAAREVREETGLIVRAEHLIGIYDSRIHGSRNPHHFYNVVFLCKVEGGVARLTAEAADLGYFAADALPAPIAASHRAAVHDALALAGAAPGKVEREPSFDP